jgi:hypothetical protein
MRKAPDPVPNAEDYLVLAQQCFAQARGTLDPRAKQALRRIGEDYLQRAKAMQEKTKGIGPARSKSDGET